MQKMTSAYANKMIRTLEEEKALLLSKESDSCTYVAQVGEEPVIPEYDYAEVYGAIAAIDEKIAIIKHALNLSNAQAQIPVGDTVMSVDTILIRMTQLNRRKAVLEKMRRRLVWRCAATTAETQRRSMYTPTTMWSWQSRIMRSCPGPSSICRWRWISTTRRCSLM